MTNVSVNEFTYKIMRMTKHIFHLWFRKYYLHDIKIIKILHGVVSDLVLARELTLLGTLIQINK